MREVLLGKLVLVLSRATPEELAAIYGFATVDHLESAESRVPSAEWKNESPRGSADCGMRSAELPGGPAYVFRWTGRDWEIVFGRGRAFHLEDTLGVRYVHYLLHHPNELISAFDLEVAITPEKGQARPCTSIQPQFDTRAKREYRRALGHLQAERERAQGAGEREKVADLDGQIKALESALKAGGGTDDTGERARGNVRKAVRVVMQKLLSGGGDERAFEQHIRATVSLGYQCLYSQPQGRIWS